MTDQRTGTDLAEALFDRHIDKLEVLCSTLVVGENRGVSSSYRSRCTIAGFSMAVPCMQSYDRAMNNVHGHS